MILMGLLVVSFAIWGIADIFRGYGAQTLIKVGDTEITQQEYSRTQRDVLRVMSSDAGRALSIQEAREAGLDNRVLERLVGGAALDTHAKSLKLGISDAALLEGIMKDPAFKDSTGKTLPKWERFKDRNAAPQFIGESMEWPGANVLNALDEAYKQKVLTPLGIKTN